ncbi:LAME_0F15500g1_1 [Lachancea meyersii CBS 8951]|uniref:LAME_0F15500g1_1 n=1 Tax=Lachancea meyersii CBS 8951 TaxID=1266667 RepID=A0A1G4JYF8_9SACH|nr:LAME_0F15500g1_1 [Lachancea meyersii CBS 8951]
MSNPDDLLLELMYEYKPHLQSYRHRINTWNELLRAFNEATGASYRQNRTLKTRFEKLKELFLNGEKLPLKNVALLQTLLDESSREPRQLEQSEQLQRPQERISAVNCQPLLDGPNRAHDKMHADADADYSSDGEENEEPGAPRPPPLDSMTIFPHTQMQRLQEQRGAKNNGFAASPAPHDFQRFSETPQFHAQNLSATDTSEAQYMDTKDHIASVLDSLKKDSHNNNPEKAFGHASDNINSLAALRQEIDVMKQNQENFQRNVLAKLNKIAELLNPPTDFLNMPFGSQPHQSQGP